MSDLPVFDFNDDDEEVIRANNDWMPSPKARAEELAIHDRIASQGLEKALPAGSVAYAGLGRYTEDLVVLAEDAYYGRTTPEIFELDFDQAVRDGLEEAWRLALAECGINADEATDAEYEVLDNEQDAAERALYGYRDWLFAHDQNSGFPLEFIMPRTGIWVNRWVAVYNGTRAQSCRDQKLKWVWTEGKDHCEDCATYNGMVFRASVWYAAGVYPQNVELGCHGYNCGCHFEPTDEPALPGQPPPMKFQSSLEDLFA